MKINKKAMMSPAIVVLSVSTLVLVVMALFIFSFKQDAISNEISIGSGLEEIYVQSEILNFYLDDMCSKVETTYNADKEFLTELKKYKNAEGNYIYAYLEQVELQISDETVKFNTKTNLLEVKLNIKLAKEAEAYDDSESSIVKTDYNSEYSCSRKL